jgi:hypothetical protein
MIYDYYFASVKRDRRLRAARTRAAAKIQDVSSDEDNDDEGSDEGSAEAADVSEDEGVENEEDLSSEGSVIETGDDDDEDLSEEEMEETQTEFRHRRPIAGALAMQQMNRKAINVQHSQYRDELVIDQCGNLHSSLPWVSCASRQLFAETVHYTFGAHYKFLIHVHYYHTQPLFERLQVLRLLTDYTCINTITEANTTVVLHGIYPLDDPYDQANKANENLLAWLRKYWHDGLPLFNTNLEVMFRHSASPTGRMLYGHANSHPVYQVRAEFHKECFGIVKYLRFLHDTDAAKHRELAVDFLNDWDELEHNCVSLGSRKDGRGRPIMGKYRWNIKDPLEKPTLKNYVDLIEPTFHAIAAVIESGVVEHKGPWENAVEGLAESTFRQVKYAAEQVMGEGFKTAEEKHMVKALPEADAAAAVSTL